MIAVFDPMNVFRLIRYNVHGYSECIVHIQGIAILDVKGGGV